MFWNKTVSHAVDSGIHMLISHACCLRMHACSDVRAVSSGVCCPNTFKFGHQPRWNTCCWGETMRTNPICISDMLNISSSPESGHCVATGENFKANCSNLCRDNKSKLGWGQCNALHCKMTKCCRGCSMVRHPCICLCPGFYLKLFPLYTWVYVKLWEWNDIIV